MPEVIEATARDTTPAPPEKPTPEEEPDTAAVPALQEKNEAVSAMAEAVLSMPGVAGRDEFLSLAMQARILSMSGAAPEMVRNNPYIAFHVALVGRDLGLSPSAAMELIDIIPGKGGPQLSLSPQLMNAQVQRMYGGAIVPARQAVDYCEAVAFGPGGRDRRCGKTWPEHAEDCTCDVLGVAAFSWEDARMAGLVGPKCEPGSHVKDQQRSSQGRTWKVCGCNQGYITWPKRMMWQRSCGFAADDYFPGAGLGLYTPEALGAVVDAEGRPIDPASIALPEGYEPKAIAGGPDDDDPADPDELWLLQAKLHALPDEQKQAWREQKMLQDRLRGRPTYMFGARAFRLATSMVAGLESAARRKGYDPAEAVENVLMLCATNLIAYLCVTSPEGEVESPPAGEPEPAPEPGTPDPGPDTPEPGQEPAAPAQEPEDSHASGPEGAGQEKPGAGPSVGDVAEIRAGVERTVTGMSVEEVRRDLRDLKIPGEGPVPTIRARLVTKMVADILAAQTEEAF